MGASCPGLSDSATGGGGGEPPPPPPCKRSPAHDLRFEPPTQQSLQWCCREVKPWLQTLLQTPRPNPRYDRWWVTRPVVRSRLGERASDKTDTPKCPLTTVSYPTAVFGCPPNLRSSVMGARSCLLPFLNRTPHWAVQGPETRPVPDHFLWPSSLVLSLRVPCVCRYTGGQTAPSFSHPKALRRIVMNFWRRNRRKTPLTSARAEQQLCRCSANAFLHRTLTRNAPNSDREMCRTQGAAVQCCPHYA